MLRWKNVWVYFTTVRCYNVLINIKGKCPFERHTNILNGFQYSLSPPYSLVQKSDI